MRKKVSARGRPALGGKSLPAGRQGSKNLRTAYGFFAVFFILIFVSIFLKFALVVRDSKFDGQNRFTVEVSSRGAGISRLVGQNDSVKVLSFSPKNKSIAILRIEGDVPNIVRFLEIPIDGRLESNLSFSKKSMGSDLTKTFFNLGGLETNLTFIDISKLIFFTKTVEQSEIFEKELSSQSSKGEIQSIVSNFFIDPGIVEERKSMEVINATDVPGLGNRVANLVSNMGGNVILVSTSQSTQERSEVQYTQERSYTVKKLSQVLGFKTVKKNTSSISDVIIIIGKDALGHLQF